MEGFKNVVFGDSSLPDHLYTWLKISLPVEIVSLSKGSLKIGSFLKSTYQDIILQKLWEVEKDGKLAEIQYPKGPEIPQSPLL